MTFRAIFISFKSQELVFQLNDDEVDDPMRKKLMKLGLPDIQFDWPENDSDFFRSSLEVSIDKEILLVVGSE